MITVCDHYVPTEKSDAPPHNNKYVRTSEAAYSWLCNLLAYGHSVRGVKAEGSIVSIIAAENGRNTGSLFEMTFSGPIAEMVPCLSAAYYWYDGDCVEPPLNYPFPDADTRQQVLADIQKRLPLRNAVGDLLRMSGYEPLVLEGLYDTRGLASMWVGVMAYAGITDPEILEVGAAMDFKVLFEICEYMRVFDMSFAEAQGQLEGARVSVCC
jgi:hypothetical protein